MEKLYCCDIAHMLVCPVRFGLDFYDNFDTSQEVYPRVLTFLFFVLFFF